MRGRQQVAHHARGLAGVDQVVDDQHALALLAHRRHFGRDAFEHLELALVLVVVVARHAHGLDQPHIQFARHDRRRHQPAARDGDDGLERPGLVQPPGQRARVAVELVPGDGKDFFRARRLSGCGFAMVYC